MGTAQSNPIIEYNCPSFAPVTRWDVLRIAGVDSPGYLEIEGWGRKAGWDKKTGKGSQGTTQTYKAKPAAEGSFHFYFWNGAQMSAWATQFLPLFVYDPTRQSVTPVSITHPSLLDLQIKAILAESITPIMHIGDNLYKVTVKATEYTPPPKANASTTPTAPKSLTPDVTGTRKTPQDPLQAKIAQLWGQFNGSGP